MWFITQLLNIGELQYTALTVISSSNKVGKAIQLRNRFPLRLKGAEFSVWSLLVYLFLRKKKHKKYFLLSLIFSLNNNENF